MSGGGTPRGDGPLVPLPPQPVEVPWPTRAWPTAEAVDGVALGPLLDEALDPDGDLAQTYAVVVVQGGAVVAERYGGALGH